MYVIMDNEKIEFYRDKYFTFDEPVPYKLRCGDEIFIHPITMKDWAIFISYCDVLKIDKNSISRPEIISMTYLKYLNDIQFKFDRKNDGEDFTYGDLQRYKFQQVMQMCLHEQYVDTVYSSGRVVCVIGNVDKDQKIDVKGIMTNKEFLEVVDIIFCQNFVDYDDSKLDPKVKKMYDDYIKLKTEGQYNPTLEQKYNFVLVHSSIKPEDFKNMTYRRFIGVYQCALDESLYFSTRLAEVSPKFDVKKFRDFYMFEKKDKYNGFILSDERANEIKTQVGAFNE